MWRARGVGEKWPPPAGAACIVLRDVLCLLAGLVLLTFFLIPFNLRLPHFDASVCLALFAVAAGAVACMLALLSARLTGDRRIGRMGAAIGCYSLVEIPIAMLDVLEAGPSREMDVALLVAHALVVALLLMTVVAPDRPQTMRTRWTAFGALLALAAGIGLTVVFRGAVLPSTGSLEAAALPLATTSLGLTIALVSLRESVYPLWRVGLGFALLGVAHVVRISRNGPQATETGLLFSSIRLAAVLLVMWGVLRLAQGALTRIGEEHAAHEEDLRLAEISLARAAERDHELRNGLAGLAGATNLLGAERRSSDTAALGTAVASELARLDQLLRMPAGAPRSPRDGTYAVEPVLNGLVALRRSSGMDVVSEAEPGLHAQGASTTLAQVVTNLLANAARHAPGSPVRVTARRDGEQVVVLVRDFGPGVPEGDLSFVFTRGARGDASPGQGLGLHICRHLLAAEKGTISIAPPDPDEPGCAVTVRLTAAPARVGRQVADGPGKVSMAS